MAPTPREALLHEIDAWHAEGLITPEQWATLRARYPPEPPGERTRSAADWLQLVGGLLLGAAVVAFVAFAIGLDASDRRVPALAMMGGSAIALIGAFALEQWRGDARPGLVEALLAAALVPAAFASAAGSEPSSRWIAWIGLVPRQDSTGGKQKLGPISKQGDRYLRRILVVGAHAVLRYAKQNPEKYPWLTQLLARRPFKVVAVALANKMARIAWALLAKGGTYRAPALAATA